MSRARQIEKSQLKPKPYVPRRTTRIIVVDDFGEMKSGEYLKFFTRFLSIATCILLGAGALLYYGYTKVSMENGLTRETLAIAKQKLTDLTREKELLMARLVMAGKDPVIRDESDPQNTLSNGPVEQVNPALSSMAETEGNSLETPFEQKVPGTIEKTVDLEKFSVEKDEPTGDLLVRFDIRNISKQAGDVSGRIFIVLKPDTDSEDQWLVVPKSAIKNGIPSEYKKGQYFSIASFKPVKFRIKNPGDPELYKKACVFVFNEQADLIFEKLIDIT